MHVALPHSKINAIFIKGKSILGITSLFEPTDDRVLFIHVKLTFVALLLGQFGLRVPVLFFFWKW